MNAADIDTTTSLEQAIEDALTTPCRSQKGGCARTASWVFLAPCGYESPVCTWHRDLWLAEIRVTRYWSCDGTCYHNVGEERWERLQ